MYIYNKDSNKYYSKKGKELFGCARDNCEIHRLGGWGNIKEATAKLLNIVSKQDEEIKSLKKAISLLISQNEIRKLGNKKF